MSLFFDYKANLRNEQPVAVAWSNMEHQPLLAVGTNAGHVYMLQEEGEIAPGLNLSRHCAPSKILWHPYLPLLYIGWQDGMITIWNEEEKTQREEKSVHGCDITCMITSPDGSRMVTGDEHGIVGVWSTSRGLNAICQYHKEGAITHATYCALLTDEPPTFDQMSTYFFFGGTSTSVYLADDLKRCSEVCKVGGQIKSLLYYKEENSIIIITSSLLMVMFKVSSQNEKLVPDKKVKLTIAGSPENIRTIWGGPGLLVTVSGENMIRLWNLGQDKNYFLTLADADSTGKLLNDRVISVAFNERRHILAAGTQSGRVVMWKSKNVTDGEAPGKSEEWEPQPPVSLTNSPVTTVDWGYGEGILSAFSTSELSILSETVLRKKMKETIMVL